MATWNRNNTRALVIAGLAVLALPATRKALRPLVVAGTHGMMNLGDKLRSLSAGAQEAMEDIVAEAHFKRLQMKAADGTVEATTLGISAGVTLASGDSDAQGMEGTGEGNTPGTLDM